jgi:hypothetical protein
MRKADVRSVCVGLQELFQDAHVQLYFDFNL